MMNVYLAKCYSELVFIRKIEYESAIGRIYQIYNSPFPLS